MKVNSHDPERVEVLNRRSLLFRGGVGAVLAIIGGRLYQLQILDHQDFVDLAQDNQFNTRVLVPLRGEIVDRFGKPLASNGKHYRLLFVPEQTKNVDAALASIGEIIDLPLERRARIKRQINRRGPFTPMSIDENLSWDEFSRVNFDLPSLPGAQPEIGVSRLYPFGAATAFVVGYVGAVTDPDLQRAEEAEKPILRQPGFRIGRDGLERTYERELRGVAGAVDVKVNAFGQVIEEVADKAVEPQQGQSLTLTIDAELQLAAFNALAGESASAVVIDVITGDLLVLASTPAFDPNDFTFGIDDAVWKELNQSPYKPLIDKPLAATYPPGSTLKIVSALAAQRAGIKPTQRYGCNYRFWYGNRFFHCWKKEGHGYVDMKGSLKHSCDVFYYNIATQLDIDLLADTARKMGLGQTYDFGVPAEKRGVVPDRAWKKAYYASTPENQTWFQGETLSAIIGQGSYTSTPLQLAVMAARLATGRQVTPRIVRYRGAVEIPPPAFAPVDIDPSYFDVVRAGVDAVVNEGGTAARSRLSKPEWRMGGKTGTSQVYVITAAERARGLTEPEDLPWQRRDHALFVCYAPVDNPRYACSVVIEHGIGGSRAAAPKAKQIMEAVLAKNPGALSAFDPRVVAQSRGAARKG